MTDQELDQMMRRALLDAAAQEAEALPQEPPELSPRHGRSMRAMLRDPLAWARSRRRPALRTAARHAAARPAAAVLLVLVLSAAVLRWVQPVLWPLAASVPAGADYAMLLLLIADGFFTARILRRSGDIDLLSPRKLLRELRT